MVCEAREEKSSDVNGDEKKVDEDEEKVSVVVCKYIDTWCCRVPAKR